jgi:hypothetical protein
VCSDAEQVPGIGDRGVGGIQVAAGKLAIYAAVAGIRPGRILPGRPGRPARAPRQPRWITYAPGVPLVASHPAPARGPLAAPDRPSPRWQARGRPPSRDRPRVVLAARRRTLGKYVPRR